MKRLGLTAAVVLLAAVSAKAGLGENRSAASPAGRAQVDAWIELLDHDDFAKREEASRQLVDAGAAAITAVAKAAASDSQEVAWRCGVILQQIGISGDEAVMTEVIRAMAMLEKSGKRSFKQSGAEIINRWRRHRDDRAIAAVRRLGGEVVDSAPEGFVGGFGGFGGGFAPPVAIDGPVIVDFDDIRLDVIKVREPLKAELLKDLKLKIEEEAKPVEKPAEPVKPLAIPALPDADLEPDGARLDAPPADEKPDDKRNEFKAEEVERFVDELKKVGMGVDPLSLRIAPKHADRVEDADEVQVEVEEDIEEVVEFEALDELLVEEFDVAPLAVPVFGGGFGGGVAVWDVDSASQPSRLVRLGKAWKGTSADLLTLREISGLVTLELHEFDLDAAAIKQIAHLKKLRRLLVQHSSFDREKLLALKRANSALSIYATGKTLLGVAGQPHGDGFVVTNVVAGTAAHNAGMMVGDVITQAEGIKLTSVDELTIAIAHKNVGDPLPITFKRNGKLHDVEIKLGPRQVLP